MDLPALGVSSLSKKATSLAAIAACGALLAVHGNSLYIARGEIDARHLLLLAVAPLLADILSGLIHWTADTWGSESTPIVGPRFIRPFRVHHLNGADIVSRDFLDLNGDVALGVVPLLTLALLAPTSLRLFLVALSVCILPTNQIHQWAHRDNVPPAVRLLQRFRVILRHSDHMLHHTEPFRSHYCITTGWANPFLEKTRALARIENFVHSKSV